MDIAVEVRRLIAWRLGVLLSVAMLVAMMDRINLSFAALTMMPDIGISAAELGIGTALFFAAYLVAEIPSNMALARFGARRWIARIMASWGLVSMLMAFVQTEWHFYLLRFLLGVAEAGFVPGVLLYLTWWLPEAQRGRVTSAFLMVMPIAGIVTAFASGLVLRLDGLFGLAGWRWIFIVEAVPALLLAIVILKYLDDRPDDARWLTPEQKHWLNTTLAAERAGHAGEPAAGALRVIGSILTNPVKRALALGYMCINIGIALTTWTPQILQRPELDPSLIAWLTGLPNTLAAIAMYGWSRSSDRRGERRRHLIAAALLGAAGFALAAIGNGTATILLGMTIATASAFAMFAVFWTVPPLILVPGERPVGIAAISLAGVIAGMVCHLAAGQLRDMTGGYTMSLALAAAALLLAGLALNRATRQAQH